LPDMGRGRRLPQASAPPHPPCFWTCISSTARGAGHGFGPV